MSFIASIIATLLMQLIKFLIGLGLAKEEQLEAFRKATQTAEEDKKKIDDAQTDKDLEDAAKSINDHTFGS